MSSTPKGSELDSLTKKPSRVVPVTIFALLLVAAGGFGIWLLGTYAATGNWPQPASNAINTVAGTQLSDPAVIAIAAAVAVLGLIFLIAGITPGDSPNREVLDDEIPGQTAISRRDLAGWVQSKVERVDGAQSASATMNKNTLDVHIHTPIDNTDAVRRRTEKTVTQALEDFRPADSIKPRIRVIRTD